MRVFDDGIGGFGSDQVRGIGLWEYVYLCCNWSSGDSGSCSTCGLCISCASRLYSLGNRNISLFSFSFSFYFFEVEIVYFIKPKEIVNIFFI